MTRYMVMNLAVPSLPKETLIIAPLKVQIWGTLFVSQVPEADLSEL